MSKGNEPEEIKIPVPWGHISGKWWGSQDKQPVLAVHGWQDNAGSFDKLAPLLRSDISLLCIDLPGHGFSSPYHKGHFYYIHWDGLIVVRQIVKYFKWEKISIIGHSLGGAIGFLYAAIFPNEIEKLICIDSVSPAFLDKSEMVNMMGPAIDKFLKYEKCTEEAVPCHPYEEMLDIMMHGHNGSLTLESCKIMMKRGAYHDTKSNNYMFSRDVRLLAIVAFISLDVAMEHASYITCKVMNIKAMPGPKYRRHHIYQKVIDKIKETAEKFEYHEVKGTHHLHLNNPQDIITYVNNFLDS